MIPSRAYIFLGLNAVRVLSIISLILVFSSSIFVMVNDVKAFNSFQSAVQHNPNANSTDLFVDCDYIEGSTVPNQPAGIFWAVVSRLLIIFQVIVLVMSEVGWPSAFFDNYFPVLGRSFGLGALGIFECLIGATILSHHVDDFTLVAAFFLFALGCLNMLLGLIFREKAKDKRSITSWRAEAQGILPKHLDNRPVFVNATPAFMSRNTTGVSTDDNEKAYAAHEFPASRDSTRFGGGFGGYGPKAEKAAGLKGFLISRPVESLPRYATSPPTNHRSLMPGARRGAAAPASSRASTVSSTSSSSSFASPGSPPLAPPAGPYRNDAPPQFKSSATAL